tara:strand:+ start:299 stop:502 length:204 start_codon:yes stop_codon:yes gene_type:complete
MDCPIKNKECVLDSQGYCIGCYMTEEEVNNYSSLTDEQKEDLHYELDLRVKIIEIARQRNDDAKSSS